MNIIPIKVSAGISGFPSPASEFTESGLSLDDLVIRYPSETYFVEAVETNMQEVGIFEHDMLVCCRQTHPHHGSVVIGTANGEQFCRILDNEHQLLLTGAGSAADIHLRESDEFSIDAVAIASVRQFERFNTHSPNSLNSLIVRHRDATYFAVASGRSMEGAGIFDGDVLVCCRQTKAKRNSVLVVSLNGELACKYLDRNSRSLVSASNTNPEIPITPSDHFSIEAVVIASIRRLEPFLTM